MWIISLTYAVTDDSINIRYKLFIYSKDVRVYTHIYVYFVSTGDPTVYLTSLVIGSVFFEGLKMTR